jgi:hypothetical protein
MVRTIALATALLAVLPARGDDALAVLAVAEPPAGPDADLSELAHQLRAACRDRIGGVSDVPTMRARLLGRRSKATVTELDRAYGGALAVYQNGEFESAIGTLGAIVEDLESLPETEEAYSQWVRAQLRLAHAALTIGREKDAEEAMLAVARTDPAVQPDPDQYSPSYRRRFEQAKARVRALPVRELEVNAVGPHGTVFVNGRATGTTPLTVSLPAGIYRVGGTAGTLHVPSVRVDLREGGVSLVLDFALAEALRVHAGPGLALGQARRADAIVRAGAWLGVHRVVAVSRISEGEALFLLGSIYDVRNGALLREGSVRMVAGTVPAANLGALATFLLTGQSSREVVDRTDLARSAPRRAPGIPVEPAGELGSVAAREAGPVPGVDGAAVADAAAAAGDRAARDLSPARRSFAAPALVEAEPAGRAGPAPRRARWLRPAAYGSAILFGLFTGVAIHQGLAARQATADADAMVGPGGVLAPGSSAARYDDLRHDSRVAARNAYVSAGAAIVFAATAGVLGWRSRAPAGEPALALRF